MLRTLAERLSRGVVLRRRLPASLGGATLFVSPDAGLRFWRPSLDRADPMLFAWTPELVRQGHVVWDIGANVGLFSFSAAALAGPTGRVLAVEADIFLASLLRRSAFGQMPGHAPVEVVPVAVSDTVGLARFAIAARGRCSNYLEAVEGSSQAGGARDTVTVVTVTLDWLLERLPAPQVVKMDIEGAELEALGGATRLLDEVRPTFLCEISRKRDEVLKLFAEHRYLLADADGGPPGRPELTSGNVIARPR